MIAEKPGAVGLIGVAKFNVTWSPACFDPPSSTATVTSGLAGFE